MRKIIIALAALAALCASPAYAAPIYLPTPPSTLGNSVAAVDQDGASIRAIAPIVSLTDSTGLAIGTSGNPLITTPSASATSTVTGNVASGATDTGNPVKVGCVFNATPVTVATGQRVDCQAGASGFVRAELWTPGSTTSSINTNFPSTDAKTFASGSANTLVVSAIPFNFNGTTWDRGTGDVNGLVTQPWALAPKRWNYAAATGGIVNTATAVTIAAAGGASVRNYLTSCQISHDTLGAATEFAVRDGASGTVLYRTKLQTAAVESEALNFGAPLKGTASTLMEAVTLTAVTGGVYLNCQGFTGS